MITERANLVSNYIENNFLAPNKDLVHSVILLLVSSRTYQQFFVF